jgi:hypothetical protein
MTGLANFTMPVNVTVQPEALPLLRNFQGSGESLTQKEVCMRTSL